jgi:hypothetical protein
MKLSPAFGTTPLVNRHVPADKQNVVPDPFAFTTDCKSCDGDTDTPLQPAADAEPFATVTETGEVEDGDEEGRDVVDGDEDGRDVVDGDDVDGEDEDGEDEDGVEEDADEDERDEDDGGGEDGGGADDSGGAKAFERFATVSLTSTLVPTFPAAS